MVKVSTTPAAGASPAGMKWHPYFVTSSPFLTTKVTAETLLAREAYTRNMEAPVLHDKSMNVAVAHIDSLSPGNGRM